MPQHTYVNPAALRESRGMSIAKRSAMSPRRAVAALLYSLLFVACGRGAQPGAPDGAAPDDAGVGEDAAIDADPNTPDFEAPKVVAIEPDAEVWLSEPIRFVFDEPIDATGATVTATLAGSPVPATLAFADKTVTVTLDAVGVGAVDIRIEGTIQDTAKNAAAVPITAQRTAPAWSRPAVDRGVASESPALAVTDDAFLAAWTVGSPRRVVVSKFAGSWIALGGALGAGEPTSATVTVDPAKRPLVAWSEGGSVQVMRWQAGAWAPLPSPGSGTSVVLSGTRIAFANGGTIAVRELGGNDAWQVVGDYPTGGALVGSIAFSGTAVAWIAGNRINSVNNGTAMAPIVTEGATSVSIARRGAALAIAWDETGGSMNVVAAIANGTSWTRLGPPLDVDVAGHASEPAIALDSNSRPIVAWRERIEGVDRGVIAKWTGAAWTVVGSSRWSSSATTRPTLAVRGDAPVIGSAAGGAIQVTRFNGPASPGAGMQRASMAGCNFNPNSPASTLLSTGCFSGTTAHAGLVPYDIVNELWSDGTKKRRWIGLPNGASMTATSNGSWAAPAGTIIVKEFAIETTPGNPATRRPVETRILANTPSGWRGFSYQWRANGSDADLLNDGVYTYDWPLDGGGAYRHQYPSRSQCLSCHHGSQGPLLGLRSPQLARFFDYGNAVGDQLATLSAIGVAPAASATPYTSAHDRGASYEQRARSYMAANCAHCHNPNNIAIKDLRYTTPLAQTRLCEVITPGAPQNSVVYARVTQRPGMPPLGTLAADPHADTLLYRWIAGMTSCP